MYLENRIQQLNKCSRSKSIKDRDIQNNRGNIKIKDFYVGKSNDFPKTSFN